MIDLLPPTNDYVFARLFGSETRKNVLISLLNSILNGHPHIKDIKFDQTEYKKSLPDGKSIRLDIAATSDDETKIHIEMQCSNQGDIGDRSSFYQARLRDPLLKEGEDYSSIPNIISIWICATDVTDRKSCINEIVSMYRDNGIDPVSIASEKMRQIIIELNKIDILPKLLSKKYFKIWMNLIKNPDKVSEEDKNIPEVREAMEELEYISADQETRSIFEMRNKQLNDIQNGLQIKFKEGKEEGLAEGIIKGKEEGLVEGEKNKAFDIARKMLIRGLGIDDIVEMTGLSANDITGLRV